MGKLGQFEFQMDKANSSSNFTEDLCYIFNEEKSVIL